MFWCTCSDLCFVAAGWTRSCEMQKITYFFRNLVEKHTHILTTYVLKRIHYAEVVSEILMTQNELLT